MLLVIPPTVPVNVGLARGALLFRMDVPLLSRISPLVGSVKLPSLLNIQVLSATLRSNSTYCQKPMNIGKRELCITRTT
jgi:hypothetical protein